MRNLILIKLLVLSIASSAFAATSSWPQEEPYFNLKDKASLQRGAKLFANYCQGCHSAEFVRYRRLAKDTGITDKNGVILVGVMRDNLMFSADKLGDAMDTAMQPEDAKVWFGSASPPDLSLIARKRNAAWLYTYLKSFYKDDNRPWGVNNALFPNVAMPHVLAELQGTQEAVYKTVDIHGMQKKVIDKLEVTEAGSLSAEEYDDAIIDLVNFLVYIGEPMKLERQSVGVWAVLFMVFFALLAFFLKRAFWKQVH